MTLQAPSSAAQAKGTRQDPLGFRPLLSLLKRYWFSKPLLLTFCTSLLLLSVGADVIVPLAAGEVVDQIVRSSKTGINPHGAYQALCLFAATSTCSFLTRHARTHLWNGLATYNMSALLNDIFGRVQRFSAEWYANTFAGATVRKITRGKWAYDAISDITWIHFLELSLVVCGITGVMLYRFPRVGLMFVGTVLVYVVLSGLVALRYVRPANVQAAEADSAIGAYLADTITNNATVKTFGAEDREAKRFSKVVSHWSNRALISWNRGSRMSAMQQALWVVLQFGTILLLIHEAAQGQASPGDITFALTANFQLGGQLRSVGDHIRQLQRATSEFSDLVEFHEQPVEQPLPKNCRPFNVPTGAIEFDSITFAYQPEVPPLYQNLDLRIRPGERVALVGPTGSGKSTLVKLVQRLYDLNEGSIRIDGQDIAKICPSDLRRQIAVVPQDPLLFHRSLRDNIAYGNPEASKAEVALAARRAHASEFIERLPYGYDTLVGERGVKLSGGERQRVAIARAFLANAPIVIFDEATSSLDNITEKYIKSAMDDLMQGRTTIVIAHRLSTVSDVDRILVFDSGKIVEQGPHHELIRLPHGRYRALHAQAT